MTTPFKITALGVGDAFSARYYASSLLLEYGESRLLIDCPHPMRRMLAEATSGRVDLSDVDAVILTHLHADHVSGLEPVGFYKHFIARQPLPLILHPQVQQRLWVDCLAAGMDQLRDAQGQRHAMTFADYFRVVQLDTQASASFGPFTIDCRFTHHHIPTTALRIEAGGRVLGYSSDTCFDPDLIEWLSSADLIIHECNLGTHTPYQALAALPASIRSRLHLIHYHDHFLDRPREIPALSEGQHLDV